MYTERLRILHEIDQGILAAQSPKAIAQAAVSRIRQLIPCQRAGVVLINAETGEVEIVAVDAAIESQIAEDTRIQLDRLEDVVEELRQGRVAVFEDLQSRGEMFEILYAEGVRSSVSVPLMFKGELIGALTFWLADRDGFAPEHVVAARQLADTGTSQSSNCSTGLCIALTAGGKCQAQAHSNHHQNYIQIFNHFYTSIIFEKMFFSVSLLYQLLIVHIIYPIDQNNQANNPLSL